MRRIGHWCFLQLPRHLLGNASTPRVLLRGPAERVWTISTRSHGEMVVNSEFVSAERVLYTVGCSSVTDIPPGWRQLYYPRRVSDMLWYTYLTKFELGSIAAAVDQHSSSRTAPASVEKSETKMSTNQISIHGGNSDTGSNDAQGAIRSSASG